MPKWLLHQSFDLLLNCFEFYSERKEKKDFKTKHEWAKYKSEYLKKLRVYNWIRKQFIYSKFMLPNGNIYLIEGGIPSGSYLT
jgi:hypothetical protein